MNKIVLAAFTLMQANLAWSSVYVQVDNFTYSIQESIPNLKDPSELRFRVVEKHGKKCGNQILAISFNLTESYQQDGNARKKQEVRDAIAEQIIRYSKKYRKNLYLLVEEDMNLQGKIPDFIAGNLANFALYKISGKKIKEDSALKNLRSLIQFSSPLDQASYVSTTHQSLDETTKHEANQGTSHSELK